MSEGGKSQQITMPISHGSRRALEKIDKEIPIKLLPAKYVSSSYKPHKYFIINPQIVMEEVSPYSVEAVFLVQLVIITVYSPCAAVKRTIRIATIRDENTPTHTHIPTQVYG